MSISSLRRLSCVAWLTLAACLSTTAPGATAAPETALPQGKRVFSCSHSFHRFVAGLLLEMAKAAGIQGHETAGMSSIGGSRVQQHWDAPDEKFGTKAALTAGKVDVLMLAPIWMPDEGIDNFAKLAFEHNPNVVVTVQEYWLPNDTYEPKYPLDTRKQVDHNATVPADLQKAQDAYDHDVDEYVKGINQKLGKKVIVTVPVGQAAVKLREKILAGTAPGLAKQWDLFRDNWGHPQIALQVLDAYCHYAVIYQRSPVGLPVPAALAKEQKPETEVALNRLLQELAWDAVTHHPISGVTAKAP